MIDNQIMSAVLDVGEAMLTSGGEVSRIEQMMTRMCKAYGAERVDAFSITSSMIVTVKLPGDGGLRIYAGAGGGKGFKKADDAGENS